MTSRYGIVAAAALLALAASMPVHADPVSSLAVDNATVQPGGPRSGTNGKAFFNIEGSANGSFASYGVADFNFGTLPLAVLSVNSAELELVQSNAGFSTTGAVTLSLDQTSPGVDIQPGTSPLAFDGVDPGTATDVGDGDLTLLGVGGGMYTVGLNGDVDVYPLALDAMSAGELVSRLNNGDPIRIVVGTGEPSVAATWAGYANSTYAGPKLNLDVTYDTGVPARSGTWGRIKSMYR